MSLVVAACGACGDDGNKTPDAAAQPIAITGEIVDWDSGAGAAFCGVFQAKLTQHDDATNTVTTAPNGRITLMVPDSTGVQIDVTPPTSASQCATGGLYQVPGVIVTNQGVLESGLTQSYRLIGMDRLTALYTSLGLTYDSAKAIVFVHVEGTHQAVKSTAAHGAAAAFDGTAWAAGDTGDDVVFPNTLPGTTMVDFTAGSAKGAMSVTATAGTITYVTLIGI
ncbi:MAG: hypothetical protein ABI678_20420 [Kofleriaceae bacterium]